MRRLGLRKATAVGVGAIVGGGVLVLAGPAFQAAGPGALLAFAFNGVLALLTAMSFAEMSSRFPESGGAYTYAKKVLSVQAAFGVGWILWFAYIVAGVLYAMGFAEYAVAGAAELLGEGTGVSRAWVTVLAFLAVATSTGLLARGQGGAGQWAVPAKLIVFAVLIVVGGACWLWQGPEPGFSRLDPVFPTGVGGVVQAMGLTFIAFQGFDSIATIAGEVKEPGRTLPRAMFYSLGAALLVYLPLLFLVAAGGTTEGESIQSVAAQYPETVVAVAIRRLMGDAGYWFVIVAAVLSTLTALHANLLAASRVAYRMAQDRTLPRVIADGDSRTGTPLMAIYATALASVAILLMVRDLSAAGAAASLIFLIAFALAHMTSFLARQRYAGSGEGVYEAPAFPWVPLVGGIACGGMAVFQVITAPDAGGVIAVWLGFGGLLYFSLFRSRARTVDAMLEAHDPSLAQLRGRSPLVLVPVSNPTTAAAMAAVGNAVAAPQVGRVLLLSVMAPPASEGEAEAETGAVLTRAERIFRAALTESMGAGFTPETLFTIAKDLGTRFTRSDSP